MADDIVSELRERAMFDQDGEPVEDSTATYTLLRRAADEIVRLREALAEAERK